MTWFKSALTESLKEFEFKIKTYENLQINWKIEFSYYIEKGSQLFI